MTIAGKKSIHFHKKDLQDQKVPAIGFKNLVFAHEATAGDLTIDLSSLTLPSSGINANFVNPSAADLAAAKLLFNEKNLMLVSSLSGLLSFDSYSVKDNNTIVLKNAAAAGEIFMGTINPIIKTGLQVVDVDPIVVTGTLAAGADEFIVGKPFDLNKYPSTQQGAIMVFLDGQLLARNVGNQQSSTGDGDYYEVDVGSLVGNSIKINNVDAINDRSVMVVSSGLVAAAPSDSLIAQIENVAGQVDQMVPTLAALAGVAESTFQTAPNSVDLKAFGDRMLAAESDIDAAQSDLTALGEGGDASANGPVLATASTSGAVPNYSTDSSIANSTGHTPAASNINFYFTKVDNLVNVTMDGFTVGGTSASGFILFSGVVPVSMRPSEDKYFAVPTREGNVNKIGGAIVFANGDIRFGGSATDDTFSGVTSNGLPGGFQASWNIN